MRIFRKRLFVYTMLLSIPVVAISYSNKSVPAPNAVGPADSLTEEMSGIERSSGHEGKINVKQEVHLFKVEAFNKEAKAQWGLEGESANVVLDKINIKNLKATYNGDGITFTISADKAIYDKSTLDIELNNNIIAVTSDGGVLVTDYARWDSKAEEIQTDSHVIVRRENITCLGRGMVSKPRLKLVTLREDIEVKIAPDKVIICDGPFEVDHKKSVAIFNNNVRITDKDSQTYTDKLTVYLNPETNEVSRIVTEGNVRVVHTGDVTGMGEMAF
ncbi:MAG: LPS export ABC transporter periplasmic protein LptC [Candidatus Omnitrophota bacterium]